MNKCQKIQELLKSGGDRHTDNLTSQIFTPLSTVVTEIQKEGKNYVYIISGTHMKSDRVMADNICKKVDQYFKDNSATIVRDCDYDIDPEQQYYHYRFHVMVKWH